MALHFPGHRIDGLPKDTAFGVGNVLSVAGTALEDAALCLRDFETHRGAPREGERRRPFVAARGMLMALATVERALKLLLKEVPGNAALTAAAASFKTALPSLHGVRNSAEHIEDRVLRRGPGGKKIAPKPFKTEGIAVRGSGVIVADVLIDNCYGATLEDGSFAEVEISQQTLDAAERAVQAAIDGLIWR